MKSSESSLSVEEAKRNVNAYFVTESSHWNEIYHKKDVYSVIHQERRIAAIRMFDELTLPRESRILEIGCGAGLTSIDIATRGYSVEAVDSTAVMVDLTKQNARNSGVEQKISAKINDIHDLKFGDDSMDIVIALGVAPWIVDLKTAMKEIFRVLAPGGYLIISADHRYRLNHLLDPAHMPVFAGLKELLRKLLEDAGLKKIAGIPRVKRHTATEFDNLLAWAGLVKMRHCMIGFGPFSFLKIKLLPDAIEIKLHRLLQRAADQGVPLLRSTGSQYLVLARKR